jgi:hypothetical protein
VGPLIGVVLTILAGFPLAASLTRRMLLAGLIAPLVTGLTAALAAMGMLVAGGDLRAWMAALLALQYAAAIWLFRRAIRPLPYGSSADVLWLVVPLLLPLTLVLSAPIEWDPHSIWWTHAGYFSHGADFARDAIGGQSYLFSHPDYPPLLSAQVAAVWSVAPGGVNFYVAQFVSATLSISAVGTLGYAVRWVTGRSRPAVSRLAGVLTGLAAWATVPYIVAQGFADALWSAALVGGAVLLLLGERPLARPVLPVLLLTTAVLTKNEALGAVVAVTLLVTLRERRNLRRVWPVWIPILAGLSWMALARSLHASSDVTSDANVHGLLTGDKAVLDRIPVIMDGLGRTIGLTGAIAVAVALLGTVVLRTRRRALGLGSDLWLWGVNAIYVLSVFLTYLVNNQGIQWYVATSVDRVTLPAVLLFCVSVVCWAVTAVGPPRAVPRPAPREDLSPVSSASG